jgi:hypothetical protein
MHTINYLLHLTWRVIFFPVAMLALLATAGWHGFVTFITFGLIVYALRYVRLS